MERKRINAVLTVAALALTLLIPTALPLAGTAAPRLEPQPSESLIGLNSTEATESGAPSVASVVQSPGTTTCVSVASNGAQGNRQSTAPSISADGRYVAFASLASNLVSGDTNNEPDIFVHDRETGQTNRVSVASDGTQGNGGSYMPSISADGRYAAFKSSASNLVPGDTNGYEDIFVHDRETAQTERVSVASDGTQGNHWSSYLVISADGRYVAFASLASNLVSGDTNNELDIFVHDRETSQTKRVSVASDGAQADGGSWYNPSISADGRYVAFGSVASNLVPGDTNGMQDVFVHDRGTGQTTRISVASEGTQGNRGSWWPSISADGRYVAFPSLANNLVLGDTNGENDVFVRDRGATSTPCDAPSADACADVGDPNDESYHNLSGWGSSEIGGPVVPPSGDQSKRFQVLRGDNSLDLFVPYANVSYTLFTEVEDGGCDDSFQIYVNGQGPVYTYHADPTIDTGVAHTAILPASMISTTIVEITYRNIASDNCGLAAVFNAKLEVGGTGKPPVVLVHGWQGLGIPGIDGNDCTDTPTRVYPGTNRFLGNVPQWLYALGYTEIYEVNLTTGPGYTPLFEENAECLRRQLESVTGGTRKAILIAHSMGGLVSRAYIENENLYQDDVVRLITLGSPHAGINGGFLLKSLLGLVLPEDVAAYCDKDQGTCQLSTDGVLLFNQDHSLRAPSVCYDFIGGRNWMTDPLGWVLRFSDGPNDSRVGLASATGRLWLPIPGEDKVQVDGQFVYRFQTNETHSGYFRDEPGDTRSCLQYLLDENGTGGSCVEATAVMAQAQAPAIAYSPDVRGHITSSQTVTHSLQVDTDGASLFYLSWVTGTLGITLTNPVGTVIDPAYATAHTDVVTYTTSPGGEMTFPFASYAFTTTVPGLYTTTITADDVGITGTDYLLFAAMETTRTLSVALDSDHYQIGDTAVLTTTLEGVGGGITGATVQATFSRSDAITDTLTLTDQGDGTYRGTYAIPNAPGYLHLRVTAEGSDVGTQFSRQVDRLLTIASQAVQLTGTYADRADDADGNGRYETLTVDVEVLVALGGDFTFSADLVAGGDQFVAHVITQTALITGTQSVPLSFDGELIHEGGRDGPFTVTNLLISDLQNAGIPSVMADEVWTTAAYDHTQFGRITGDVNGDCIVTVVDIMLVASRWNTTIGDIHYDAAYDLDKDGDIDVADIMFVAAHWREKCE